MNLLSSLFCYRGTKKSKKLSDYGMYYCKITQIIRSKIIQLYKNDLFWKNLNDFD